MVKRALTHLAGMAFFLTLPVAAWADRPVPGGLSLQEAASPIADKAYAFHNHLLLPITTAVVIFVFLLMAWIVIRYNRRANPTPSRTTHNTLLEVVWTLVPILILLVIAVPSFRILSFEDTIPEADLTIKATGNQWYWTYEYPDNGGFYFDANMKADDQLSSDEPRLLATDNNVVVPVGATVKVLVTGSDVIHSWAVPAFGVKIDAVPGRLNETWFKAEREGVYYGQCSELCGKRHGFMPIAVEVVSPEAFKAWVVKAKERYASAAPAQPITVASLEQ